MLATTEEGSSPSKRSCISSMMSSKSTMYDSMKKPKISAKNSSSNVGIGRLGVPYCIGHITMEIYACGIC